MLQTAMRNSSHGSLEHRKPEFFPLVCLVQLSTCFCLVFNFKNQLATDKGGFVARINPKMGVFGIKKVMQQIIKIAKIQVHPYESFPLDQHMVMRTILDILKISFCDGTESNSRCPIYCLIQTSILVAKNVLVLLFKQWITEKFPAIFQSCNFFVLQLSSLAIFFILSNFVICVHK